MIYENDYTKGTAASVKVKDRIIGEISHGLLLVDMKKRIPGRHKLGSS